MSNPAYKKGFSDGTGQHVENTCPPPRLLYCTRPRRS